VAITDNAESTDSTISVVKVTEPLRPANVEAAFQTAYGRPPELYRNGHRYFRARAWRSPSALEFDIRAYDDAEPDREYIGHFLYGLDGMVQQRRNR
jgi:hypothetical protein